MKEADFNSYMFKLIDSQLNDAFAKLRAKEKLDVELRPITPSSEELKQLWAKIKAICVLNDVNIALPQYTIKDQDCYEGMSISQHARELILVVPRKRDSGDEEAMDIKLNVRIFKRKPDRKVTVRFKFDEALMFFDSRGSE